MRVPSMKRHPLSACYWDLDDDALAALAADIKKHGLRQPIVMYQGQVLDGWQRFRACQIAKVQHRETTYSGDDPAGYVESLNEQRRHGNAGQRSLAIVQIRQWQKGGRPTETGQFCPVSTNAEMAKAAGSSERTIKDAKRVVSDGVDPLVEAVRRDEVAVHKAAEIAKLPKKDQRRALKAAKEKAEPKAEREPTVTLSQYKALEEKYEELVDELKTYTAISNDEAAKEMSVLRASLKQANRSRDDAMRESAEKGKQIRRLEGELKKLGWKGFARRAA